VPEVPAREVQDVDAAGAPARLNVNAYDTIVSYSMKKTVSGRFVLRLPPRLHAKLRQEAAREDVSLNTLCQQVLERHFGEGPRASVSGGKESGLVARIVEWLGDSLQGVVLFGSVARAAARRDSDIDLLIVLSSDSEVTRRLYGDWDTRFPEEALSPHFVRLPDRAATAGTVWLEASVDGILWYDREGGVSRCLAAIRRMIAKGQISRREAYGLPYWVRKNGEPHVQ
jgi:predicted nucleotidyltransferase